MTASELRALLDSIITPVADPDVFVQGFLLTDYVRIQRHGSDKLILGSEHES
jgi:hypothetical protein